MRGVPARIGRFYLCWLILFSCLPQYAASQTAEAVRPLFLLSETPIQEVLGSEIILLDEASRIETFLHEIDGSPPSWKNVYGPNGDGHMERLVALNEKRNQKRLGKEGLTRPLAFLWEGILSSYNEEEKGFSLAIGPKIIPTSWGDVRFKPYQLPANLIARPNVQRRAGLIRNQNKKGRSIEVLLLLRGRLIPEESIIYDFAHEEPGKGMVMPVIHIEQVDFFLVEEG